RDAASETLCGELPPRLAVGQMQIHIHRAEQLEKIAMRHRARMPNDARAALPAIDGRLTHDVNGCAVDQQRRDDLRRDVLSIGVVAEDADVYAFVPWWIDRGRNRRRNDQQRRSDSSQLLENLRQSLLDAGDLRDDSLSREVEDSGGQTCVPRAEAELR